MCSELFSIGCVVISFDFEMYFAPEVNSNILQCLIFSNLIFQAYLGLFTNRLLFLSRSVAMGVITLSKFL